MKKTFWFSTLFITCLLGISSCKKDAGEGGNSSIKGKVFGKYYSKTFVTLLGTQYVPDHDVYIVYGDETSFGDRIRTNYDGAFEFKFLRKGSYKVFVYSKDSTMKAPSGIIPVIQTVEISKNGQSETLPDLVIFNN
jgi:hypothetical protein